PSRNYRQFTSAEPCCSKDGRQITPSERITDKFKKGDPALNVFMAAKHELRSNTEALVMEPYVEALPIQCLPTPSLTIHVEGYPLKCVIDTGAGPSLVVPERIANMILTRKYATLGEVHRAIIPPLGKVQIASCTGGDVPIVGQAIVNMSIPGDPQKGGDIKFPTPMLIMKTDHERAECLLGVYGMTQAGFALVAPDKTELLGQNLNGIPKENWPTIDAPVKLPKTTHTQISLLQCHSTKHLELGPLHKGNIKYLGHTVSKEGLIPNPKKVDGIRSYST
ncbi:MAG: hypothetical protein GY820_19650, partial [Gammaproteobacteria bacterium]|nr:hypothetical protein [Gammaproteobacteria bacterium]